MEEIQRQVRQARRRLVWNQLVHVVTWTLLVALLPALIAIVIPKIWPLAVDPTVWLAAWLGGGIAVGLITGILWTWFCRRSELDAAIEIDRRFGLKERVSSVLALEPGDLESAGGKALVEDARERMKRIDVGEHFHAEWNWHPLLPAVTLVAAFLIAFLVPDATRDNASASSTPQNAKRVKKSMEQLKKKLQQRKKQAEATGLKDANAIFSKFEKVADQLTKSGTDRKKALVKLNNLSKELSQRRQKLGGTEKVRKQLRQLKGIQPGPAQRMAQALKDGDMRKAMDELQKLADKLRDDKLTEEEKKQLIKQLEQLRNELDKMLGLKKELEQQKRDLQKKMEDLKKKGDREAAGKLQKKLDQVQKQLDELNKKNPQLNQLEKLANQASQCMNAMKDGKSGEAADSLNKLADSLKEMQDQLEQLETLDEAMDEIADAKKAMNCKQCDGEGCQQCQGNGASSLDMFSKKPGRGMGRGHGLGDRPEEKTDTGGYRTRVRATPRAGEAIRVGDAGGTNISGSSRESIKQEIAGSYSEDPDPVVHQRLPRREREQTREYFEKLRTGR